MTLLETIGFLSSHQVPVLGITTTSYRISLLVPRAFIDKSVELCYSQWVVNSV
ncbi:MAG: hypothetical protein JRI93_15775 [Deltaproteobacteria bacterium]|nr:hypothetical protein [Deltaproteobacteria bacterium]